MIFFNLKAFNRQFITPEYDNNSEEHSGYFYYIDGYKKQMRLSQTTVKDIKITAIKNAIEWHWSPTSEMVGTLVKFQKSVENHSI